MITYSKVITAPLVEPITLDEAKKQVKMEGTTIDDTYLTTLITASRQECESCSGLSFITQERRIHLDGFPRACETRNLRVDRYGNYDLTIVVPYGPVQSIDSLTYFDSDGVEQTLVEGTDFRVDTHSGICRIEPIDGWPAAQRRINAVKVDYTAGYGDAAANVLQVVKEAIKRTLANLYEHRTDKLQGSLSAVDYTARRLLDTVKVEWNAWQD